MAHPPPYPDRGDETGVGPDRGAARGAPRWVAVLLIVVAALVFLLIVVVHLVGAIGPGAH